MNNADFGLSLQKMICDYYCLDVNDWAKSQFDSNFNSSYASELKPLIPVIFESIKSKPVRLLTYSDELVGVKQTTSPHNFLLSNGKSLSIRTNKSSDKVAPRTVGQAGFPILNDYFSEIYGKTIETQWDIKQLVYNHIHEIFPIFIDNLFQSDVTVFISRQDLSNIQVIYAEDVADYSFSRDEFEFTKDLISWNESTTLKYHGKSIAEIQTHKERSFKFRFIVSAIPYWFNTIKETTESLGISAEGAICEYFSLEEPESFKGRVIRKYVELLMPSVKEAFNTLPRAIKHSGSLPGERGEQSKSSYDFVLQGDQTLSLKTNKGKMVCPPEVGQPGSKTCLLYFKKFFPQGTDNVSRDAFKKMVFDNIEKIMPMYVQHLFDSDWLLWIYETPDGFCHREISKADIIEFEWYRQKFSFTKNTLEEWNESNTVKYNGLTIGEFQVHKNRNCFKFRFHMSNLLSVVTKGEKNEK